MFLEVVVWRFEQRTSYISVHCRSWHANMSLAFNEPKWVSLQFKIKHYWRACTTSGKKLLIWYANSQWTIIGDNFPTKHSIDTEDNSIRPTYNQFSSHKCHRDFRLKNLKKKYTLTTGDQLSLKASSLSWKVQHSSGRLHSSTYILNIILMIIH